MKKLQRGFTLVEMVVVIAITGIVAGMVVMFMRWPAQSYVDSQSRAELTDVADTALRRMARDVRLALPNSIRVATADGKQYMEFLMTKTGGRYLADEDSPTAGNILSFTDNTRLTFDVVGNMPTGTQAITTGDQIVVYNLGPGMAPADAYNCAGTPIVCNRAQVTGISGNTITLANNPFANQTPTLASPGRYFHVVSSPVSYVCDTSTGTLTRYWGYTIASGQPTSTTAAPLSTAAQGVLASGVTACSFSYDNVAGNLAGQRSGLAGFSLTLQSSNASNAVSGSVTLFHQVHVDNTP